MEEYVEKRRNEQGEDLEALKSVQSGLETQMTKAPLIFLRVSQPPEQNKATWQSYFGQG